MAHQKNRPKPIIGTSTLLLVSSDSLGANSIKTGNALINKTNGSMDKVASNMRLDGTAWLFFRIRKAIIQPTKPNSPAKQARIADVWIGKVNPSKRLEKSTSFRKNRVIVLDNAKAIA